MQAISKLYKSTYNYLYPLYDKESYKSMTIETISDLMTKNKINIDDNLVTDGKETVLSYAIEANNAPLVSYLCSKTTEKLLNSYEFHVPSLNSKIHASGTGLYLHTALHQCLNLRDKIDRTEIVEILLNHGSNPNLPRLLNANVLIRPIDVLGKSAKITALLVEHGALATTFTGKAKIIPKLWEVYKTAYMSLSKNASLLKELNEKIRDDLIKKIGFHNLTILGLTDI